VANSNIFLSKTLSFRICWAGSESSDSLSAELDELDESLLEDELLSLLSLFFFFLTFFSGFLDTFFLLVFQSFSQIPFCQFFIHFLSNLTTLSKRSGTTPFAIVSFSSLC